MTPKYKADGLYLIGPDDEGACLCINNTAAQRLAEKLNEAEVDKARLDWLEKGTALRWQSASGVQRDGSDQDVEWVEVSDGDCIGYGDTVRKAIDHALSQPEFTPSPNR